MKLEDSVVRLVEQVADLKDALFEARNLACLMYEILRQQPTQQPTDPGDLDSALALERLPDWLREPQARDA